MRNYPLYKPLLELLLIAYVIIAAFTIGFVCTAAIHSFFTLSKDVGLLVWLLLSGINVMTFTFLIQKTTKEN